MRRFLLGVTVALLGPALAAFALPLCDYRSPLTDLSNLVLSFSYEYHNDPYGIESLDVSSGEFVVDYVRLYDRPEYGFDIDLYSQMLITATDVSSHSIAADGSYKRYFASEGDYFAFAGASSRSSSSYSSIGLLVNAGVGYGRFTDVTPLATATRIDDYLVRRGSLSHHLHAVDLRILAYEIGSAASYESTAALLTIVQQIIEESGFVRDGGLDALDISQMTQLIQDEGYTRYCGWDAKVGLGYEIFDPSGGDSDLLVTAAFNYALSAAPNTQLLLQGILSGSPDIRTTNRIDVSASYDYIVHDFLTLQVGYAFSRETWVGEPTDIHQVTLDLVLTPFRTSDVVLGLVLEHRPYYLEWSVDATLSISIELL